MGLCLSWWQVSHRGREVEAGTLKGEEEEQEEEKEEKVEGGEERRRREGGREGGRGDRGTGAVGMRDT